MNSKINDILLKIVSIFNIVLAVLIFIEKIDFHFIWVIIVSNTVLVALSFKNVKKDKHLE